MPRAKTTKAIEKAQADGKVRLYPGRPTDLTQAIAEGIVLGVRTGAPLKVAAMAQGVRPATFLEWMARGEGRDPDRPSTPLYAEFADRVRRAEAEVHMLTVATIRNAAVTRGSWDAARAWLRMRWPEDYAERTEVSGPGGEAVPLEIVGILSEMSESDLDALAARLRNPLPGRGRTRPEVEG